MYVCICHGVTESEIAAALDAGARTPEQVGADCKAGTGCGTCVAKIRELINASAADHGKLSLTGIPAADDRRPPCVAIGRSSNSSTNS